VSYDQMRARAFLDLVNAAMKSVPLNIPPFGRCSRIQFANGVGMQIPYLHSNEGCLVAEHFMFPYQANLGFVDEKDWTDLVAGSFAEDDSRWKRLVMVPKLRPFPL
jgi:hypothetical protein